jgi:hypothetical protein
MAKSGESAGKEVRLWENLLIEENSTMGTICGVYGFDSEARQQPKLYVR